MKNMSTFQYIIIGLFIGFALLAVIVFALQKRGASEPAVELTVWGEMPAADFEAATDPLLEGPSAPFTFRYSRISPDNLGEQLIEALAFDSAPDLLLYSEATLLSERQHLEHISYEAYPERRFRDSFIEAGEVFANEDGIYALPIVVDPMVLYWNRTLFSNAGRVATPQNWDEIAAFVEDLTRRNGISIEQSAIALGTVSNITHSSDIVSLLLLQSGNPITVWNGDSIRRALAPEGSTASSIAQSVTRFYVEFSNPSKPVYSWNSALPSAQDVFIANNLAMYLGFASELGVIRRRNPNLNFDVAAVPQVDPNSPTSFGHVMGVGVVSRSPQKASAIQAAAMLSGRVFVDSFASTLTLPPARRDLLQNRPSEAFMSLFYTTAINAATWPNPDPTRSEQVINSMIEAVNTGRLRPSEAVMQAHNEL